MPNHYTTMLICSPGYEFDCELFNRQHQNSNLCAIVQPMPEPLEPVCVGYNSGLKRWIDSEDGPLPVNEQELRTSYGAADPLEFARENWGTKWGTYDVEAFDLGGDGSPVLIKFQSAWNAPKLEGIIEWLKRTAEFEKVVPLGFEPYDDEMHRLGLDGEHVIKMEAV